MRGIAALRFGFRRRIDACTAMNIRPPPPVDTPAARPATFQPGQASSHRFCALYRFHENSRQPSRRATADAHQPGHRHREDEARVDIAPSQWRNGMAAAIAARRRAAVIRLPDFTPRTPTGNFSGGRHAGQAGVTPPQIRSRQRLLLHCRQLVMSGGSSLLRHIVFEKSR